jgi:hypothetical protein
MAKFYGPIGFADRVESRPGYWKDTIKERNYSGDIQQNSRRWTASQESTNDDLTVNLQISIIADPFAYDHFHTMRYVRFMGANWKITNVDPSSYPRLILTVGGVYNGPTES